MGHSVSPASEAIDIHAVSFNQEAENNPQQQSRCHDKKNSGFFIFPGFLAGCFIFVQMMYYRSESHAVKNEDENQGRPAGSGLF